MGGWQDLFLRHAYRRIEDCWNRTIDTAADVTVSVKLRDRPFQLLGPFTDFEFTGESRMCINMASYNYLGFGGFDSDCTPAVHEAIDTSGAATCSTGIEAGYTEEQKDLEQTVCRFLDKEDAIVVGMGYGTNATLLPAIIGPSGGRVLVVSDELNHRSIVEGVRLANAKVRTFLHNDMDHLDQVLREACESKKFDAILIVVEGIYSMEGDLGRIREIVSLKKKYGAMMYLDEAHSIGAVGKTGRGVCELLGVPTSDVDIMMGTFTKSFGSVGGYVASTKSIIDRIRNDSPASAYAMSMSVPAIVQANKAFAVIMGPDGKGTSKGLKKIQQLDDNSCYFRERLRKMGCKVLGDMNSPVVPVMLFHNEKISIFSRLCLSRGLAVVVVGYPATPVFLSRVRFCLSAGHTRKMLDDALEIIEWAATATGILYDKGNPEETEEEKEYSKAMRTAPLFIGKVNCALDSQKILGALPVQSCHSPPPSPSGVRAGRANDKIELRKHDHLSLMTHPLTNVVKKAHMAIDHYGCGTCGPRGFYGTTPLHLDVEKHMAEFLGQEACISYSNFLATTSSVIPAFAKRNDVCFVDEECNYGVIAGLRLARADVVVFKHNDAEDLKRCMEEHAVACEKMKDGFKGRKFVITEGVFANRGTIAPLPEIVALKKKHRAWLILDESYSIGVLGEGKGLSAHFGIPASDIDMQIGSFEHAFGSIGGFCAGAHRIVWHQVLSGAGYCFSASAPPYAMAWIDECISEFNKKGKSTLKTRAARVVEDSTKLYAQLEKEFAGIREIEVSGSEGSPLVLLRGNPEAYVSFSIYNFKISNIVHEIYFYARAFIFFLPEKSDTRNRISNSF